MKNENFQYRRYLVIYLSVLAVLALPLLADYYFIRKTGEIMPFSQIVERQQKENAIYGPAYGGVDFRYRLALIRHRRPDILITGASRVMEYREESFHGSFVNAGGSMNHLNEGLIFLKEAFKVHRPKVLIIGLEFSWFNDEFAQPTVFASHSADETQLTRDKVLDPIVRVLSGSLPWQVYFSVLVGRPVEPSNFANPYYGISAMTSRHGNLPDGSTLYSSLYTRTTSYEGAKFADMLSRIRRGSGRFEYGAHMSATRWRVFEEIVDLCKANNVKLVTIMNPLAPSILAVMKSMKPKYQYIDELNAALKARKDFEYYDFADATAFGSNDCEFLDGFHHGHIACFRLLRDLVRRNPASVLASEVRTDFIKREVEKYAGRTLWPGKLKVRFERETDFLELGCKK